MDAFATVMIKLHDDGNHEFEIDWQAISTLEHKRKLAAAAAALSEITQREIDATEKLSPAIS